MKQTNDAETEFEPPDSIKKLEKKWNKKFEGVINHENYISSSTCKYIITHGKLNGLALSGIDLTRNDLTDFKDIEILLLNNCATPKPTFLLSFHRLTRLTLENMGIHDCSFLKPFTSLTHLDLTHNQVKDYSPLDSLVSLKYLSLSDNHIERCHLLDSLPNLTTLRLTLNQISDCSPLASLNSLILLNIEGNQIKNCSPLAHLATLQCLAASSNEIIDCSPLGSLTHLKSLFLSKNQIQDCTHLKTLHSLTYLYLSENQIQDCAHLAPLTSLKELYLNNNQIKDCSPLVALTKLNSLRLVNNQIQDCRPLAKLVRADLEFIWTKSDVEDGINLYGNPLTCPPVEIAARGHEAIMAWLAAQSQNKRDLSEAKILFVGKGGSGKTSLVNAIVGRPFDEHQKQTHGIAVDPWTPVCEDRELKIHLWDFGGQDIMYATHQFFLTQRSLYLLVLDSRKEDGLEDEWLRMIQSFGGDAPILVVLTKADENRSYDVNRRELIEKFPNIIAFHRISSSSGDGIEELKQSLMKALLQMDLVKTSWPETWFQVKSRLETMAEPYITYDRYSEICTEQHLYAEDQRKTLLQYLNDLGTVLHFPDLEWLNTQVLKPNWVTKPIYALINHPELAENFGELNLNDLRRLLTDFPSDRLPYLRAIMERFEICHPLDAGSILLPDLLPVGEPELPLLPSGTDLHLCFSYNYVPRSLMARLMVRHYRLIRTNPPLRYQWRTGALFYHMGLDSNVLARVDYPNRRIDLRASGPRRDEFLLLLRKTLIELHQGYLHIDPIEWIRCICVECRVAIKPALYDTLDLRRFQAKGISVKQCPKSGQSLSVEALLEYTYGPRIETEKDLVSLLARLIDPFEGHDKFQTLASKLAESLDLPKSLRIGACIDKAWLGAKS